MTANGAEAAGNRMSDSVKVSVVLPTYNEAPNIRAFLEALTSRLSNSDYEVIVVDDDSPDLTWRIVEDMGRENPRIRVTRRLNERSLTSAMNEGIAEARGEWVMCMDSDFQHPLELVPQLLAAIDEGYDVVLTSRYIGESAAPSEHTTPKSFIIRLQTVLTRLLSHFGHRFLHPAITDWSSGCLAIRRSIFNDYSLRGDYGEYYIRLMHHIATRGYSIEEIPYVLNIRTKGDSKLTNSYASFFAKGIRYVAAVFVLLASGRR